MIASERTPGEERAIAGGDRAITPADPPEGPVSTLRGAGVDVDPRRAGRVAIGICLVALAVVAVVLLVAGIQKNDQANNLHHHGVVVDVTVSNCIGLLGGSGSNVAGYACKGTYSVNGHHYEEAIPGSNSILRAGSVIRGVTVPGDPGLLSTPAMVAAQRASWKVYIAPAILLVVLLLSVATLILRRRHLRVPASSGR